MVNTMTETVLHRIPVTGVMDLLITTNGCIDILGGVDIQFMLTVRWGRPDPGETVDSPISLEAAKEIFMSNCAMEREHFSVENQWSETYGQAVESARRLREEGRREDEDLLLRSDMPF